jgi:hypothetical protein
MYTEEELIDYIISSLNTVSVIGTANMSKILGCVEALKEIKKNLNNPDKPKEDGEVNAE